MVSIARRGTSAVSAVALAATLALSTTGVAHAATVPTTDPAEAAAGYLASALADGERIQSEFDGELFDAPGTTADAVYALSAVGVAAGSITAATDWLETQAGTYTGAGGEVWAGATGKLLIVAATTDRDPRSFGGVDLVAKAESVEVTAPDPDDATDLLGRYRDVSGFGDFSTPLTQALVLLGLHRSEGADPSPDAVQVLLDQQCADGGFSASFLTADADACTSSVDTTGYAAQALHALGETEAVTDAVAWLASVQSPDGSFGSADGQNTNSAGLAAVALAIGGGDAAAVARARDFIIGVQDDASSDTPGAIPFNATERGFVALATAQALPGLVGVGLGEVSAAGASSDVPILVDGSGGTDDEGTGGDEPVDETPTTEVEDDGAAGAGDSDSTADGAADDGEIEQPVRVDAGLSPSANPVSGWLGAAAMLLAAALIGAVVARRRGHGHV